MPMPNEDTGCFTLFCFLCGAVVCGGLGLGIGLITCGFVQALGVGIVATVCGGLAGAGFGCWGSQR